MFERSGATTHYPRASCVHELFARQAARAPQAIALVSEEGRLTYQELDERSNQLAHYLRRLGVGPESPVGLCVERSFAAVIGLLGILKAGGAYVPLDPECPRERLAIHCEDADLKLILTQSRLQSMLPADRQLLAVDNDWSAIGCLDTGGLDPGVVPENLAYVMYTSGSTGRPKGVAVPHRGVVRLVTEADYAVMNPAQVFLLMAPLTFDASTFELWAPLLNGGTLAVLRPGRASLQEIGSAIREYGVTTLWLTAGLFHALVDTMPGLLQPLRQLLAGGDVLSVPHVRKALERLPNCHLVNGYGPTEGTTFTCCHRIRARDLSTSIPIGRPIANTQVHILDERHEPVPAGAEGELYIGGDGLARGYFNRPEITAERFVPHPRSDKPGARLYRSGDRVRYREDGTIEFLGRADQQVKIRGYRIEPGEIEAVLVRHASVCQVAVIAREATAGSRQLVAYCTPVRAGALTLCDLRRYAEEQLPAYMVPARFVITPSLPLTQNGKVDRAALRDPDEPQDSVPADERPRDELERAIAQLWRDRLGLNRLGVDENFFDVGGDSLSLAQVHSRLQCLVKRDLPIAKLFQYPTVASLAAHLAGEKGPSASERVDERVLRQKEALARQRAAFRGARS